ncbi:MAG: hydrolase [Oscillospiraceae bacterium]
MRRLFALLFALCLTLTACGTVPAAPPAASDPPAQADGAVPSPDEAAAPAEVLPPQEPSFDLTTVTLVPWEGAVEHLFFHPVIAYPQLAFDGDSQANGLDDWMITVGEYNKILQSLYDKNYVLVDINQVWKEGVDAAGKPVMVRQELLVPEGKMPLILSYDDVNYYQYMLKDGLTYKLIIGEDGRLWSQGKDPDGKEVISQDLDALPILDKFVRAHPDFSPYGAKGCLSLTGYEGILGYRTMTEKEDTSAAHEANRQKEIQAVKPIIAELKRTGWTFGSHTWGHINLAKKSLSVVQADTVKWQNEVGSLVGETSILFYPHGARPDGSDVESTGAIFKYLQGQGFRVFCSVGNESYSKIKPDVCAVICDRLHPDGTTLRSANARERYLKFYDAKDIIDLSVRPQRAIGWQ